MDIQILMEFFLNHRVSLPIGGKRINVGSDLLVQMAFALLLPVTIDRPSQHKSASGRILYALYSNSASGTKMIDVHF